MKILVVCQYYYPEPFRISDICEELVKRGHEVTVLTGVPNYPEGIIYDGYKNGAKRDEFINGVHVIHSWIIPRKKGAFYRLLNYYSYVLSSCWKVLCNKVYPADRGEFDVVFVNQLSPVMMAYAGMLYSYLHKKKMIMYCLDLWPESLVAGGIKKNSIIYKIFNTVSNHIYRSSDYILVTSQSFISHLSNKFSIDKNKISYLPQYAENIFCGLMENNNNDTINLVFAGNIGEVQDVETIIKAAEILKNEKKILFHIVGSGTDLDRLKKIVISREIDNIVFYGRRPVDEMPQFYAMADAMLITLANDPLLSLTLPGKIQSYMAAGKPIIGAINGEAQRIIEVSKCGLVCNSGDFVNLANIIQKFSQMSKYETNKFSINSRNFYSQNFKKSIFFNSLQKIIER